MTLEILTRLPDKETGKPPLLFVHGAWLAAWCWDENFLPFFARAGYPACAVSLRGHGGSSGSVHWASVSDYVADVAEAVAQLPAAPVLIGHSMGGYVVQKYLETHDAPGAVLLASAPPYGMAGAFIDAWRRHPLRWLQANLSNNTKSLFATPDLCREFFFSLATPDEEIVRFMQRANDESHRALIDLIFPNFVDPGKIRTPLLVLGGEKDIVFPPRDVLETARRYNAAAKILPGLPHAMMLDVLWREAADAIADFLPQATGARDVCALN
ncbi:alpha/beta hydrolase [Rhodoblastus acidophilus]|uniref:Alpha/beta hydrolase n=1 Tax=Candidatus Rhodoblastus alkanivorans TaxID=2954117 RepID=A0ABS9ZBC1_9HYPH|nr:alpha/beta fold hydrolase [Candidatus Rhodoblastus alkanivorans]MCI4677871.1 alpha/beta hydrolase [Candidatus Rhodoblastus alkanivorans]MCI4684630.1 alpha/beta hydrolase [Candidatus Rhodoblastus alkanivorans]